eukprot:gene25286-31723_t
MTLSKLGAVANNMFSPYLAHETGNIVVSVAFGTLLCLLCMGFVLITLPIDQKMDEEYLLLEQSKYNPIADSESQKAISIPNNDKVESASQKSVDEAAEEPEPEPIDDSSSLQAVVASSWTDMRTLPVIFWVMVISCIAVYGAIFPFNNISSSLLLERDYFKIDTNPSCALQHSGCQSDTNLPNAFCETSQWYQPPLPYDVTVGGEHYSQVTYQDVDCANPLWASTITGCAVEYCARQVAAESKASVFMSIPYLITAVFAPPLGYAIDLYGFRAVIMLIAPVILVVVHLALSLTKCGPLWPLVGQGVAYTGMSPNPDFQG